MYVYDVLDNLTSKLSWDFNANIENEKNLLAM